MPYGVLKTKKWQLSEDKIAEALLFPDEVLKGHGGRYIAHKLHKDHVLRAVYEYHADYPTIVTVYFPYAGRYYQGGSKYEDNILK
jgi:hypothetical protein